MTNIEMTPITTVSIGLDELNLPLQTQKGAPIADSVMTDPNLPEGTSIEEAGSGELPTIVALEAQATNTTIQEMMAFVDDDSVPPQIC